MEMIRHLEIENYKSIKHLTLNCNRVNVIIGEPNVGKSNILEALDLSYLSWMLHQSSSNINARKEAIDIKKYFRVNKVRDLFRLGDTTQLIKISHPGFSNGTQLKYIQENDLINRGEVKNYFEVSAGGRFTQFDNDFISNKFTGFFGSPLDPYRYKENLEFHDTGNYMDTLMPPFGNNLIEVIDSHKDFLSLIVDLVEPFGLEAILDVSNHKLLFQKKISAGAAYLIDYNSLADTLRRVIFYTAAIRYTSGYVVTLEEPDAHSFPKFVSFLADEIIENNNKQFFVATHSPYLLNNLIENTPKGELAVFVCGFDKENGTTARKLSDQDLSELLDYGVDIFFNINKYSDDRVEHNS
jgi:AAA15 family ATPase/GTPase